MCDHEEQTQTPALQYPQHPPKPPNMKINHSNLTVFIFLSIDAWIWRKDSAQNNREKRTLKVFDNSMVH